MNWVALYKWTQRDYIQIMHVSKQVKLTYPLWNQSCRQFWFYVQDFLGDVALLGFFL